MSVRSVITSGIPLGVGLPNVPNYGVLQESDPTCDIGV
jgi:hypothetical protein